MSLTGWKPKVLKRGTNVKSYRPLFIFIVIFFVWELICFYLLSFRAQWNCHLHQRPHGGCYSQRFFPQQSASSLCKWAPTKLKSIFLQLKTFLSPDIWDYLQFDFFFSSCLGLGFASKWSRVPRRWGWRRLRLQHKDKPLRLWDHNGIFHLCSTFAFKCVTACRSGRVCCRSQTNQMSHVNLDIQNNSLTKDEDMSFKLYEDKLHYWQCKVPVIINYLFYDVYSCYGNRPCQSAAFQYQKKAVYRSLHNSKR